MTNGLPQAATGAILSAGIRATHRIEDLPGVTGSKATTLPHPKPSPAGVWDAQRKLWRLPKSPARKPKPEQRIVAGNARIWAGRYLHIWQQIPASGKKWPDMAIS
jgi:hypothetical protein